MNGQHRKDITPGLRVSITQKHDQRTGKRTSGVVQDILTTSAFHSRGIKLAAAGLVVLDKLDEVAAHLLRRRLAREGGEASRTGP